MAKLENTDIFQIQESLSSAAPTNMHSAYWNRKAQRPSHKDLKADIEQLGYCGTGRKYGVSDNAIRKWVAAYRKETITGKTQFDRGSKKSLTQSLTRENKRVSTLVLTP